MKTTLFVSPWVKEIDFDKVTAVESTLNTLNYTEAGKDKWILRHNEPSTQWQRLISEFISHYTKAKAKRKEELSCFLVRQENPHLFTITAEDKNALFKLNTCFTRICRNPLR